MSTSVFKSKMKKDMTICNLRKANGFSCRRCVCNGICNPAFEIYEYRKNRVYYLDEEEAKYIFNMDVPCEKAEALTGIGEGTIQYYRTLIRKGAYKDVRDKGTDKKGNNLRGHSESKRNNQDN